jgi:nucleosome binding factor SPN SPT16 subunit
LYLKSTVLHQWIFGYELPDTIILLKKDGTMWVAGTKKKCDFIAAAANDIPSESSIKKINLLVATKKGDEDSNKEVFETLWNESMSSGGNTKASKTQVGIVIKEREMNASGGIVGTWENKIKSGEESDKRVFDLVDVAAGISFAMSIKDENEVDLIKKSSVLANKVMKHGYVKRMEEVIDSEETVKHEDLATVVEEILEDPSKINLRVPKDDVQSCYFPIVQSGGKYDLKVSAQSSSDKLSHDVIIVSLGARYKLYCSNITRTFLVDPPKKVSETYDILLEMQDACLRAMKPGNQLKSVYRAATDFLQQRAPHLIEHLPKNLGFGMGLVFREQTMLLTSKNTIAFKNGMVFCLSVGFQNLTLSESDRHITNSKSPVSIPIK